MLHWGDTSQTPEIVHFKNYLNLKMTEVFYIGGQKYPSTVVSGIQISEDLGDKNIRQQLFLGSRFRKA